jgi:hypothetical protein
VRSDGLPERRKHRKVEDDDAIEAGDDDRLDALVFRVSIAVVPWSPAAAG